MKKNKLYLAYGSNLNLEQMAKRCPYAVPLGTAVLEGYGLLFRGGNKDAVATIEEKQGASVPVLVWEITPRDEEALDRYEGYPFLYRKETIETTFKGRKIKAMAYIMTDGHSLGAPCEQYLDTIAKGYETAGFDPAALHSAAALSQQAAVKESGVSRLPDSIYSTGR